MVVGWLVVSLDEELVVVGRLGAVFDETELLSGWTGIGGEEDVVGVGLGLERSTRSTRCSSLISNWANFSTAVSRRQ